MDRFGEDGFRRAVMEEVTTGRSVPVARTVVRNTHGPWVCSGRGCWVHNPSPWPLAWAPVDHVTARAEAMPGTRFVRFCEHDRPHEDRDAAYFRVEVQGGPEEQCDCTCRCCEGDAEPDLEQGQVWTADPDELAEGTFEITTFTGSIYRIDGPNMTLTRDPSAGIARPLQLYDGRHKLTRFGGPIVTGRPALVWVELERDTAADRYLLTSPVTKLVRL